ncbi:MAG: IS110 family transposase [Saprospiraceae bacterium]|jgi:transposase|nr:IS110 family transposase [Saprospiraceae bacterium]
MNAFTHVYGIDVSKDTLDYIKLDTNAQSKEKGQIKNRLKKIETWVRTLDGKCLCVVEPTGTYSSTLIYLLTKHHIKVALVSPYKSKSFMDALGVSNKTDDQAAYCLAMMGLRLDLKTYEMPSVNRIKHKQLQNAHHSMMKQSRMLKNQLHALDQLPIIDKAARKAYEQTLQVIDQQIKMLEEQMADLEEDEAFNQAKLLASSVVGIGEKTARAMMLAASCFENFESSEALCKYFGLTPNSHYSGSSVRKKGRITKMGAHYVRSLLYICTRSAIRYNQACKELYQRLRTKGKPHRVAAVAVMHKLVKQVFACVKKQVMFDNNYYLKYL